MTTIEGNEELLLPLIALYFTIVVSRVHTLYGLFHQDEKKAVAMVGLSDEGPPKADTEEVKILNFVTVDESSSSNVLRPCGCFNLKVYSWFPGLQQKSGLEIMSSTFGDHVLLTGPSCSKAG